MKQTALLLALSLLLCACTAAPAETTLPPETTAPTVTTAPPETTLPPETTVPPETTLPMETTAPPTLSETPLITGVPTDPELYQQMLNASEGNWYNRAIGCVFASPEEIDLDFLFYLGVEVPGSWPDLTDEEVAELEAAGLWRDMDLQFLPIDTMNTILTDTFGIHLEDVEVLPEGWGFLESRQMYCSNHNDVYIVVGAELTDVQIDGDLVRVHYTVPGSHYNTQTEEFMDSPALTLTLRWTGEGFHVVSNLPQS